jgi:tetratricopeptide (TPR) repeat protein
LAAELPKTAVFSLEIAIKQNPTDKKLALQMADAYASSGQISKAESLYREIIKLNPGDPELQQELKALAARRTMAEGGYEKLEDGEGSYRDVLRDEQGAIELEQAGRAVKTPELAEKLIAKKVKEFEAEPNDMNLARSIADLYFEQKEFDNALIYLEKIKESDKGADPSIEKRFTEISLQMIDERINSLDREDIDFEENARTLKQERLEVEIQSARRMAERYPSELQFRFELGEILFKAGKISEAIQEFQKAQANPHRRVATLNYLGQCFSKRGLHDVAIRSFQKALDEKTSFDEEKKDLIYQLGLAQEAMGKKDEAIESFKQIYEVDIGFRDVGARVDAFYAEQSG